MSEISDRDPYETWKKAGSKTVVKAATEKAKKILEEHLPTPLERDVQKEIKGIIKRAEKELARKT